MRTYTAAQWALLLSEAQAAKLCLKITRSVEDDILYCSGEDPISFDGDDYVPREMEFDALAIGDPSTTGFEVIVDDADKEVRTTWYAERFSGLPCLVTLLLRFLEGGEWVNVYQVSWNCLHGGYDDAASFSVELHAAAGFRPRYGGVTATRAEFPYAPEPGTSIRIGSSTASWGGGGGGGGGDGWTPWPWGG